MPSEVILPRVDMDMSTGKIARWLVDDGTTVIKGQPLFEIETDKAAMEIEAEASGTLRRLAPAGDGDVAVGSVVAWIYRDGEATVASPERALGAGASDRVARSALPSGAEAHDRETSAGPMARAGAVRATPLARRLARERGYALATLTGSGPRGRIQAADVPGPAASPSSCGVEIVPSMPSDPLPASSPARRREAGDIRAGSLSSLRDGCGAPLVLLHGFGADRNGWRPFLQGFGSERPLLALDLPGHGSARLDGAADFDALVDAVEAALVEARLGAFTLVGHSLGGAVAAAVAARAAVDLEALVLIAPAGLGPQINRGFVEGMLGATSEASLAPWLRELVEDPAHISPGFVRATLRGREPALDDLRRVAASVFPDGTQAVSIRADLARVACPVRVIVGTADRIIPARYTDSLPGLVALHRLAGVGHLPQIEARATVQAIIAQAIRS